MRTFKLEADRIDIINGFLRNAPTGVTISADVQASHRRNLGTYQTKGVPTFDSAEDILKVVVHIGEGVATKVFADWLVQLLKKTGSKRTKVNGEELPTSESQIYTVINAAVGSTVNVAINTTQSKPEATRPEE